MPSRLRRWSFRLLRRVLRRYAPDDVAAALDFLSRASHPAFPPRNASVSRDVPAANVLVLSPHPDDEVIGMGGALHMHATNGSAVTVLYLTDGAGLGPERDGRVQVRRKEAEAVGRACRLDQIFWEIADTALTNDAQTVREMLAVLDRILPSVVYLPSIFDRHFDHFSTNAILADALRCRPDLDVTVMGYEVWDNLPFGNHVVDVSQHFEDKKRLMELYQTPLEATDFIGLLERRGAAHYLLSVDSQRVDSAARYAEVYCRLENRSFVRLFDDYVRVLKAHHSPVLQHLDRIGAAESAAAV